MHENQQNRRGNPVARVAAGTLRHIAPIACAFIAFAPSVARAETASPYDACTASHVNIPATLPANVPGLYVSSSMTPSTIELFDESGAKVKTSLAYDSCGSYTLKIEVPLVEGHKYTLSWVDCAGSGSETFTTTAAKPLPTSAGKLSIGTFDGPDVAATCDMPTYGNRWAQATLAIDPDVKPFLSIARIDLLSSGPYPGEAMSVAGDVATGTVGFKCPYAPPSIDVSARIHLAGLADPIDTETTTIGTMCPVLPECSSPGGPTDASLDPPSDDSDAGVSDSGTSNANNGQQFIKAGCGFGGGKAGAGISFVAIAATLVAARRRRRS